MLLPAAIGDYSDFYASIEHATNVGSMFRPENPLLPNYKWVPIGYHGRASSIVVSGTDVVRPSGRRETATRRAPSVRPERRLDYELEIGAFIGRGSPMGERIPIGDASAHVFGLCLLNDWSARDIQTWEYQPLGPFLAKSFATSISPWVVTLEALAPFRVPRARAPSSDPEPLAYLSDRADGEAGGFDITLEVHLSTSAMRDAGIDPVLLSRGTFADMYWTVAQLVATTRATAATSGRAISSAAARCRERPKRREDACSSARGVEPSRSRCRAARYDRFCRTETKSSCAATASAAARDESVSVNAAAASCRPAPHSRNAVVDRRG